jgi:hypothetical protein
MMGMTFNTGLISFGNTLMKRFGKSTWLLGLIVASVLGDVVSLREVSAQDGNVPLFLRSGRAFRRVGYHSGNKVLTKFQNDNLFGSRTLIAPLLPSFGWPVETNEYIFDLCLIVGVERVFRDTLVRNQGGTITRLRDGATITDDQFVRLQNRTQGIRITPFTFNGRPAFDIIDTAQYATTHQNPRGGNRTGASGFEGFYPVDGFFNPSEEFPAMSHIPNSWPASWPDRPDWVTNGRADWNGYFGRGVLSADQESYFVSDDANDRRWFDDQSTFPYGFRPRPGDPSRFGAGLQIKTRGLQWSNFLAQDNLFLLYEVKNISEFDYDKAFLGSVVGTAVGGLGQTGRNLSVFDQSRNITYTWNPRSGTDLTPDPNAVAATWNRNFPVGYAGVAFLESPGNALDGIDNDNDWNTIGNGPFRIPNRSTTVGNGGLGQFVIRGSNPNEVSETGYDFYEITRDLQQGIFVGGNAPRVVRRGSVLITIRQANQLTQQMIAAGYRDSIITYQRQAVVMPDTAIRITSLGVTRRIAIGDTLRELEGNLFDDNYNGILDESYRLHARRVRVARDIVAGRVAFEDESVVPGLARLHFINYIQLAQQGENLNDFTRFPMIDEQRNDGLDNNGNWTIADDIGADGRPGTNDRGEADGRPTPGEPSYDATDVEETDQIGLSGFRLHPASFPIMGNSENLWSFTRPSVFDTTRFEPADEDYTYGTGYFPLKRGQIERLSIAIVFGGSAAEVLNNKDIVQQIYNSNYNFTSPPRPEPRVTAVPGDRRVTLYWTADGEQFQDRFINQRITQGNGTNSPESFTFEGYKIYKSTDPAFLDPLTITGAQGEPGLLRVPVAQFDKVDSVRGYFPLSPALAERTRGVSFWLGNETGLSHTWTDNNVDNGRTYYYAVVSYSKGYINRTNPNDAFFPSENSFGGVRDSRGRLVLTPNTVVVTPQSRQAGLSESTSQDTLVPSASNKGQGKVFYTVLNPRKITSPRQINVEFVDTGNDGLNNDSTGGVDDLIEKLQPRTSFFRVLDVTNPSRPDTLLKQSGLAPTGFVRRLDNPLLYRRGGDGRLVYPATEETALIDQLGSFFTVQNENVSAPDTLRPVFKTINQVRPDSLPPVTASAVRSANGIMELYSLRFRGLGVKVTRDEYAIILRDPNSQRSDSVKLFNVPLSQIEVKSPVPTNFFVYNLTQRRRERFYVTGDYVQLNLFQRRTEQTVSIYLMIQDTYPTGANLDTLVSYNVTFDTRISNYISRSGDTLFLRGFPQILNGDNYSLSLSPATADNQKIKDALQNVKVFPNPYIVTNQAEGNLIGPDARGNPGRKIFFKNVPLGSTIRIYNIRGELLRTLQSNNPSTPPSQNQAWGERDRGNLGTFAYPTSQVEWDLKTSESLEIAYGVYLYHVDAPGIGTKTGKFAVIK